jgi:hypothetical protein
MLKHEDPIKTPRAAIILVAASIIFSFQPSVAWSRQEVGHKHSIYIPVTANWQARTLDIWWNDSRGITGIETDTANNRLILNADFNTNWPHYKGEIYLQKNLDLHGKKLVMEVFIPVGFINDPKSPEHLRLFLKSSDNWAPIYGIWNKVDYDDEGRWLVLEFDPEADPASWKNADFDPTQVREIGLAITKGSGEYSGRGLLLRNIRIKRARPINLERQVIALTPPADIKDFISSSGRNLNFSEYNYGWCVGEFPAIWGSGEHGGFSNPAMRAKLKDALLELKSKGISTVRLMALFGDLRTGILQDAEGNFIYGKRGDLQFDNKVYADVKAFLDVLHETGMTAIIALFDFRVADNIKREGSRYSNWLVGERPQIFTRLRCQNALVRLFASFFKKLYSPRFLDYNVNDVVLFWEVMNEPESASAVKFRQVVNFHDRFFRLMRRNALNAKITTSSLTVDSAFRFWKDKVDIISVHHYPDIERLNLSEAVGNYGFGDKQVYWTEFGDIDTAVGDALDNIYYSGSSGLLFWEDDYYKFSEDDYLAWVEANRR